MDETPLEKCPRCFAELREAWQFCPSCGLPLDPALAADAEIDSPHISYVRRPASPPEDRRRSRRESLVQSALHLLVLLAFLGIVTGGLLVLSPDWLGRLLATARPRPPDVTSLRKSPLGDAPSGLSKVDDIDWALVPAGPARLGDPDTWENLEEDQYVWNAPEPYLISRYEITNYQYFEYLCDRFRDTIDDSRSDGSAASWGREGPTARWRDTDYTGLNPKPDFNQMEEPVRGITFTEAQEFCRWLSKREKARCRLPMWYEWEKAARGEKGYRFPWGDEFDPRRCNLNGRGPVAGLVYGGKNPEGEEDLRDRSPYEVYNMAGNVSEWVDVPAGLTRTSLTKFTMGGDFASDDESYARTWAKTAYPPSYRAHFVGFRVLKEVE